MGTAYVHTAIADEEIDEVARRIGVQPEVLLEARVRFRISQATEGKRQASFGEAFAPKRHCRFNLWFPPAVFPDWKLCAESHGLEGSALLRAIIHGYLLGSYEPQSVVRYWYWKGKRHLSIQDPKERNKWRERAQIPIGARRALEIRSRYLGASPQAVARALVIETMRGKINRPGTYAIVDAKTMYDDETRYYLGADAELFSE